MPGEHVKIRKDTKARSTEHFYRYNGYCWYIGAVGRVEALGCRV